MNAEDKRAIAAFEEAKTLVSKIPDARLIGFDPGVLILWRGQRLNLDYYEWEMVKTILPK